MMRQYGGDELVEKSVAYLVKAHASRVLTSRACSGTAGRVWRTGDANLDDRLFDHFFEQLAAVQSLAPQDDLTERVVDDATVKVGHSRTDSTLLGTI